jgi:hypothetical protein
MSAYRGSFWIVVLGFIADNPCRGVRNMTDSYIVFGLLLHSSVYLKMPKPASKKHRTKKPKEPPMHAARVTGDVGKDTECSPTGKTVVPVACAADLCIDDDKPLRVYFGDVLP